MTFLQFELTWRMWRLMSGNKQKCAFFETGSINANLELLQRACFPSNFISCGLHRNYADCAIFYQFGAIELGVFCVCIALFYIFVS